MQQRIEYIDLAKGIGMIFVVFGHMLNHYSLEAYAIWSFHMPLFFILSGMCFNASRWSLFIPFLKRRIKTLAVPLLIFAILVHYGKCLLGFGSCPITEMPQVDKIEIGWFVLVLFLAEIIY